MPTPTLDDWRDRYELATAHRAVHNAAAAIDRILDRDPAPAPPDDATRHRLERFRDQLSELQHAMNPYATSDEGDQA